MIKLSEGEKVLLEIEAQRCIECNCKCLAGKARAIAAMVLRLRAVNTEWSKVLEEMDWR